MSHGSTVPRSSYGASDDPSSPASLSAPGAPATRRPPRLDVAEFDFDLPPERIAQVPAPERDRSRLLVLDRATGRSSHHVFSEIVDHLRPGDCLVVNNTRVIAARLDLQRASGGRLGALLLRPVAGGGRWLAMMDGGRRLTDGEVLTTERHGLAVRVDRCLGRGRFELAFPSCDATTILRSAGRVPLPPYIHRNRRPTRSAAEEEGSPHRRSGGAVDGAPDVDAALDAERYQTIYAEVDGAVAAPTAGLHFTDAVFRELAARGVERAHVTLHVGPGTFLPIRSADVTEHRVDAESFEVGDDAARLINATRREGRGRIVAVGTTTVRALESVADEDGTVRPASGATDLMILPPYRFKVVDGLVTNFHLPRSSLLVLVAAFAGREPVLAAYAEAVRREYRFYSYGDAMLIA